MAAALQNIPPKILYLITEDWFFCSHRLPLARAMRQAGFEVTVATRVQNHGQRIESEGLRLIPIGLRRGSKNPWHELRAIVEIMRIYRTVRPDIVHHVALKPVLYGSLAAKITGVPVVVNAVAGMGFIFTSDRLLAKLLRPLVMFAFRLLLNNPGSRAILQNPDDLNTLVRAGVLKTEQTVLIRGSGVDTAEFALAPEPEGAPPVIVLPARMLWDKGVGEFVEAARLLKQDGVAARFLLAGESDPDNPASIPLSQLERWRKEGIVEWLGKQENMPEVFSHAHIVCLPSYREGLPKALLEAASCGRAIVATDVPGCREIVRDGENGKLVPPRNAAALAAALKQLIEEPELRRQMGRRGREMAETEFSVEKVIGETLALYQGLLSHGKEPSAATK